VAGSKFAYGLCYAMPVDHTMQRLKLRLLPRMTRVSTRHRPIIRAAAEALFGV
jgi:hypothetical protein